MLPAVEVNEVAELVDRGLLDLLHDRLNGLALVGQQIGTESAAFGPARLESDGGSGDMGYAGSNGLEPQKVASNNQPCGFICYGFGESRCLACCMLGDR